MTALAQQGAAPSGGEAAGPTPAPTQNSSDRRLSELFYQLQVLQQEVQELRGMVEEQAYQLNRLARDQKEQYIDLDRRVAGLTTGAASVGAATAGAAGPRPSAPQTSSPSATSGGLTVPQPAAATAGSPIGTTAGSVAAVPSGAGGVGEREAYQQAFDLMKGRKFEESIASFNSLIVNYPNGQYTPNAFYWLGELYLAQQSTEQARQSFMQVVSLYPDHPKVPDTLYKLGVAYHRLGDNTRAMDYFAQVQSRYPQSSAAGLAASYAQEIR
jgi:tol-pal system protein YbgF